MEERTVSEEYQLSERRLLAPGVEFTVKGCRGIFRFLRHVRTAGGHEWIDCVGGPPDRVMQRAFDPSRIKTVKRRTERG